MNKIKYIVFAFVALIAFSCEPIGDIQNELDDNYQGPLNLNLKYELSIADYKEISKKVIADATSPEEVILGEKIAEDTLLFSSILADYIPGVIEGKSTYAGYAIGSMVRVNYRLADNVGAFANNDSSVFFKRAYYEWQQLPPYGYFYSFDDGVEYEAIDLDGWATFNLTENEDKQWSYKAFGEEKYAQMSCYKGTGGEYVSWMVSPALDLSDVLAKNVEFKSAIAYPDGATLKAFVMDTQNPEEATFKDELDATIITAEDNWNKFIESGEIDLSAYSGIVYIGFEYVADKGQTTTFRIDDFGFDFL